MHTVLMILCSASQPEVKKQLRQVEYSARYAVGLFLDDGQWNDVDWGMKYFDDPVIRYIVINGGRTVTGISSSAIPSRIVVVFKLHVFS